MYQEFIHNFNIANAPKDLGGLVYIAAGMGYHPISATDSRYSFSKGDYEPEEAERQMLQFSRDKKAILNWLDDQPTHYEYLQKHIYKS